MAVRRKQIRELVHKLLETNGIASPPVDIEKIATSRGIAINRQKVESDISGFLFRDVKNKNNVIIGANNSHPVNRQRFTIAHELGHYFLHEGEIVHLDSGDRAFTLKLRDEESSRGEDKDEKEANFFAAELLMPAGFLAKDMQNLNLDLFEETDFLKDLAEKYEVSIQALTFRLANLGYIKL